MGVVTTAAATAEVASARMSGTMVDFMVDGDEGYLSPIFELVVDLCCCEQQGMRMYVCA